MGMTEQQSIAPTVEDNSQQWKGMDGSTAWHLIDRHADNWADVGKMMDEWLKENSESPIATPATEQANTSHEDTERLNYLIKSWRIVLEVNGEYFTYNHTSGRSGPAKATPRAAIDASMNGQGNEKGGE